LTDPCGQDQYVVFHNEETEVYWNEPMKKPRLVHARHKWTDKSVQWSPHGSYLATVHLPVSIFKLIL
jgi:translation initiation factor 3 subunit B